MLNPRPFALLMHLLPARLVVGLATLGPVGTRLPAPGTFGSMAGLLFFTVVAWDWGIVGVLVLTAALALVAVPVCGGAEVRLGRRDPGEVILDEFISMPLCMAGWQWLPASWAPWAIVAAAFALFRLFDVAKPLGISRLQNLPGGWGVVADDLAAAAATCIVLHMAGLAWQLAGW